MRRQFKGMVERCADCGFDLAAGRVEVVPTAHYMMGGVEFAPIARPSGADSSWPARIRAACTAPTGWAATAWPTRRCSAAIAGDTIAAWLARDGEWREPDAAVLERAVGRAEMPFSAGRADPAALESIRERLYELMWDDAGIVRDAAGLARAAHGLDDLDARARATLGIDGGARAFNLTWHDALNLAQPHRRIACHRPRGERAREFARRPLSVGFPQRGRSRDVGLRPRPAA